jgi:hypothetical protein
MLAWAVHCCLGIIVLFVVWFVVSFSNAGRRDFE